MARAESNRAAAWISRVSRIAPGLEELLTYKRVDLPSDIKAGLSVAAVALPVGVAYAQLAGFRPEFGLYASILPLVAYAIFGTSRQLIVGPDAATCALIAAAVGPLAARNSDVYVSLSMALAFLAGVFCILASWFRLGVLADFLSKPILVGFLNGMAISMQRGARNEAFWRQRSNKSPSRCSRSTSPRRRGRDGRQKSRREKSPRRCG